MLSVSKGNAWALCLLASAITASGPSGALEPGDLLRSSTSVLRTRIIRWGRLSLCLLLRLLFFLFAFPNLNADADNNNASEN